MFIHTPYRRGISNMCAKETKGQEDKEERGGKGSYSIPLSLLSL